MITVMGATGHTGRAITHRLLAAGEKVRAVGRSESGLAELASAGADPIAGDASDAAFLTRAFDGADDLHVQEQRLRGLAATNVLILRPGSFFDNFYAVLDLIKYEGVIADSVAPDVRIPMIAVRDIADVAATALRARDWTASSCASCSASGT